MDSRPPASPLGPGEFPDPPRLRPPRLPAFHFAFPSGQPLDRARALFPFALAGDADPRRFVDRSSSSRILLS